MKVGSRTAVSMAVAGAVGAVLLFLGALQYRWIGQISTADRERMQVSLDTSVAQFVQAFRRELQRAPAAFRTDPRGGGNRDWDRYIESYAEYTRTTSFPGLLANVYLVDATESHPRLLRLDAEAGAWKPVAWPAHLEQLRPRVEPRMEPERGWRAWMVHEDIPAMTHILAEFGPPPPEGRPPEIRLTGVLILELSMERLREELLPELARKHFAGGAYDIEVTTSAPGERILYSSSTPLKARGQADARVSLLGPLPESLLALAPRRPEPGRAPGPGESTRPEGFGGRAFLLPSARDGMWELSVYHRFGSLDDAVAGLRRRNLAVSFGVLLLLAATMAMMIISTQRAHRLAKLRMNLVAGVSHEFRTPLAVIRTAADNLADGIVDPHPRVKEYGALVRGHARRLSEMVEQMLCFAAGPGAGGYDLRPIAAEPVIESTLESCQSMTGESGFTIEKHIDPGLPPVMADESALRRCLENLISNALKYGAERRWLGITARAVDGEVCIAIEDRGPGIAPSDLPHIFEPFYRARAAAASRVHGTGLGLSLAKDVAEAMGGSISVASTPGKGSVFTLHLNAAEAAARP